MCVQYSSGTPHRKDHQSREVTCPLQALWAPDPNLQRQTQSSWRACLNGTRKLTMLLAHDILVERFMLLETGTQVSDPLLVGARGSSAYLWQMG